MRPNNLFTSSPLSVFLVAALALLLASCGQSGSADPSDTADEADAAADLTDNEDLDTAEVLDAAEIEDSTDLAEDVDMRLSGEAWLALERADEAEPFPAAEGQLQAGVAHGWFNAPVGVSMAGYGGRGGDFESTWSDLFGASVGFYGFQSIKAIAFEVDGESFIYLKTPMMASESGVLDEMHRALQERHGLDLEGRVITGATHSHAAVARFWRLPRVLGVIGADSADPELIDRLAKDFADVVADAVADLGPAEWAWTSAENWDPDDEIYRDRRGVNELGKDPRLMMLAVRRPDETPLATVINFGIHGTVFGAENPLLSEDSVGGIELKFEEAFFQRHGAPVLGLFAQSGAGDASPAGDGLGHHAPARIERIGELTAPVLLDLYDGLEWRSDATLAVRSRRIDLHYDFIYDEPSDFTHPTGGPYEWGGFQCRFDTPGTSVEGEPIVCTDIEGLSGLINIPPPPIAEVNQTYTTIARLGPLFLVTFPGEPTYSIVKHLREQMALRDEGGTPPAVMTIGYSQDHLLYFSHPDDWFMGGYEAEMSLWGPEAGIWLVSKQMELVDEMLAGQNRPVFYEESPNLLPPLAPYEPRTIEESIDPGAVVEDVPQTVERTERIRFAFGGGDPSLSAPVVRVEAQTGDGWAPVEHPAGWEDAAYGNTRYQMITHYRPEPPMSPDILAERRHHWLVDWEVPLDFPAGTYRLVAEGDARQGDNVVPWQAVSQSLEVQQHENAVLEAELSGEEVLLTMTLPATSWQEEDQGNWPVTGWRLFDYQLPPTERPRVSASLAVQLSAGGSMSNVLYSEYDVEENLHRVDVSSIGLPLTEPITVRAWVREDRTPAPVEAVITQ